VALAEEGRKIVRRAEKEEEEHHVCWGRRVLHRLSLSGEGMSSTIKGLVSKNKKRYKKDGFDLDLTYICDNVIAMGFPSEKIEGLYRNNIEDVTKFLEKKHPGRYRIYNLCSERSYDPEKFKGSVVKFPFKDHNPPTLSDIPRFCMDVQNWLSKHSENVAVVHCKAGKGRTGLMICCYLLHSGKATTASESLSFYAQMRTKDRKGVTIPSQQRYVQYYEHILKSPRMQYIKRPVLLREIILEGCLGTAGSSCTIWIDFTIGDATYTSGSAGLEWKKNGGPFSLILEEPLPLQEDIKVDLHVKHLMRKERLCHFWFNTFFIDKAVDTKRGEGSSLSSCCRTMVRFSLQDPKAIRSSTDSVRDLDRTMSCPPPADTNRPPLPEEWTRWESMRKIPPVTNLMNRSTLYLSLPKSHLDKANKKVFTNKSNFKITLGFSPDESMMTSPRCFRSNSDSTQQQQPLQRYSSTSSSSSSTDDDLSSESSADSTGALVEGKHYKI